MLFKVDKLLSKSTYGDVVGRESENLECWNVENWNKTNIHFQPYYVWSQD